MSGLRSTLMMNLTTGLMGESIAYPSSDTGQPSRAARPLVGVPLGVDIGLGIGTHFAIADMFRTANKFYRINCNPM